MKCLKLKRVLLLVAGFPTRPFESLYGLVRARFDYLETCNEASTCTRRVRAWFRSSLTRLSERINGRVT